MRATTSFLLAHRSVQAAQASPLLQLHLLRAAPSVGVGNLRGLHSRALSTASAATTKNWAVRYWEHGEAQEVLKVVQVPALDVSALGSTAVHVRMLAAPINPADINMAEGVYGIKPPLPATAGNEGVGVVQSCGALVNTFKPGDWVIPADAASGTWQSEVILDEAALLPVPSDIPVEQAATLTVNPATAYRMLRDFVDLKSGDVIIQNGANSAVGVAVIQMARLLGVRTVNVVRSDRPDTDKELRLLTNLGGDINIPDTMLGTHELQTILQDLPTPKLGLNCVGGDCAVNLVRSLGPGGVMVTYGGMSKRPVNIPIDLLAYRNITLRGFWVSQWYKTAPRSSRLEMMADITDMIRSKQLTAFTVMHDIDDFSWALKQSLAPFQRRKVVLNLNPPDRLGEHDALPGAAYEVFETDYK